MRLLDVIIKLLRSTTAVSKVDNLGVTLLSRFVYTRIQLVTFGYTVRLSYEAELIITSSVREPKAIEPS
jgi:hypothetical protein